MDRRRDERYPAYFDAKVIDVANEDCSAAGFVTNISNSGVCIISSLQLQPGALVRVEIADSALLGQVVYSMAEEQSFRTGIQVTQVLIGGTDLSTLLRAMLIEAMPSTPGVLTSGASDLP